MTKQRPGKKLLSVVLALMFLMSLMTALPVSADGTTLQAALADGTILAVDGTASIPANSKIVFTVPYALADDAAVAANVVFEESNKATTEAWNTRTFKSTLSGNTLTVDFSEVGTLAMNGKYRFTFKDPAAAGTDVTFAFTTTAVDGYAMYDNFDRYPVGTLATEATNYYPFMTNVQTSNTGSSTQIVEVNNDKVLRMSIGAAVALENLVTYQTGFSASITESSVKGTTEVEFQLSPNDAKSIYEMAGIGIVAASDTTYEFYAKTTYRALNSTSTYFVKNDWTLLHTETYESKELRDAKQIIKFVTVTDATTYDSRTLQEVYLGEKKIGADVIGEGLALATGNHSAVPQGILFSKNGGNQKSTTFAIQNSWSGSEKGGSMDIYSIKYIPYKAPQAELTPSKASGSEISQTETLTFTSDQPLNPDTVTGAITMTEKAKAGTVATLTRVLPTPTLSENDTVISIAFPSGYLAPNSEYTITIANTILTKEGATLKNPGAFVYTTKADDGYYINESFERYDAGRYLYGTTAGAKPDEATMMPWSKLYGNGSAWVWNQYLVENNGDKALQLKIDYTTGYGYVGYHNAYAAAAPENASMVSGTYEIDFEISGTETTVFEVNDFILAPGTEEGTYTIRIRQGGAMQGALGDMMLELGSFTAPTATAARYTLKYDIETDAVASTNRVITQASITPAGGNEQVLSLPGGRVNINLNEKVGNIDGAINYDGGDTGYHRMFGIGETTTLDSSNYPTLNIYSIKYAPSGVTVQVAEGNANGAVDITINNKSGADNTAVIALAVYDGEKLVGVAGLADAATTITNGQSVTITKTVANAIAGNTYKVIFLNSKDSLQPLWFAAEGTIN